MARPTYYDILGAQRKDSAEQLREAFHRAQKRYHPDRARDDADRARREAAARLINEAYAVLRDPAMRVKYDDALRRASAPWARFDLAALFRGRGTWLLRMPLPGVPRMPRAQRFTAIIDEIWSTRLGQWLVLLLALGLIWAAARDSAMLPVILLVAAAGIGGFLARGGPPTPATDAEALLAALGVTTARTAHGLLGWLSGAGQRLADLRTDYERRNR